MFFDNSRQLGSSSIITWRQVTEAHIRDSIAQADVPSPIFDLIVGTNLKDQVTGSTGSGRRLQATPLTIIFDTRVSFRSEARDLDVPELIGRAFFTAEDRARYLDTLQRTGDSVFSTINALRVEINGIPQEETVPPAASSSNSTIFIIIGVCAAVAAAVIVLLVLYLRRRKPRKSHTVATRSSTAASGERMNTEILVEPQDDISTLGDPTYVVGGMTMGAIEKDDTVTPSIVSGDYDYAKNYGARPNMVPSVSGSGRTNNLLGSLDGSARGEGSSADLSAFGLTKMDNSLFADDLSFEQQFTDVETRFEVAAPAGKLGMVIDTPNGAVPIVHAIKDTSVLADRVQVGDRLISVDDEDTTGMTAMQVSKLISLKAEKPSRVLVFSRTRNRTATEDVLGP